MTYNGRRGPNVSEYIRDLNHVSPQHRSIDENFNMDEDLALFTNTQFFDFDSGQNTDFQAQPVKPDVDVTASTTPSEDVSAASVMGDMPNLDFMPGELFFVTVQRLPFCIHRRTMPCAAMRPAWVVLPCSRMWGSTAHVAPQSRARQHEGIKSGQCFCGAGYHVRVSHTALSIGTEPLARCNTPRANAASVGKSRSVWLG